MIAVTLATEDYADLAHEQAKWFRKNSGLQTVILSAKDGYAEKLEIQKIFKGQRIVFFDADFRLASKVNFANLAPSHVDWAGVSDPASEGNTFVSQDMKRFGLLSTEYINTGLFVANFAKKEIVSAFNDARQMLEDRRNGNLQGVADITEQSLLNYAIHKRWEWICATAMPFELNCYPMMHTNGWREFPANPVGLHAAGVKRDNKAMVLDAMTATFYQR